MALKKKQMLHKKVNLEKKYDIEQNNSEQSFTMFVLLI